MGTPMQLERQRQKRFRIGLGEKMRGKVTLQEIADAAGVSKFAVSRALSGKPGVSEETRAVLVKLAAQMGYFRNHPKTTGWNLGTRMPGNGRELCWCYFQIYGTRIENPGIGVLCLKAFLSA